MAGQLKGTKKKKRKSGEATSSPPFYASTQIGHLFPKKKNTPCLQHHSLSHTRIRNQSLILKSNFLPRFFFLNFFLCLSIISMYLKTLSFFFLEVKGKKNVSERHRLQSTPFSRDHGLLVVKCWTKAWGLAQLNKSFSHVLILVFFFSFLESYLHHRRRGRQVTYA